MSGDFAAGYELGHHSGYEVGYAAAEADIAEAWSAEVHRIRALAQPDDYMARVAAALSITGGEAMDPAGSMGERSACQQAADHRR